MKPIDKAILGMVSESSGRNGVNPEVASLIASFGKFVGNLIDQRVEWLRKW